MIGYNRKSEGTLLKVDVMLFWLCTSYRADDVLLSVFRVISSLYRVVGERNVQVLCLIVDGMLVPDKKRERKIESMLV